MSFSWAFTLEPRDAGRTHIVVRSRAAFAPPWVAATYWFAAPADFVMARQMLHGIKRRAEAQPRQTAPSRKDNEVVAVHDLLR